MVEIVYYVAASIDGYIATPDGGVEWLPLIETEGEDYGYHKFYDSIDAVLMGRRTYEKILEHADWPYPGKPCWVFTRRKLAAKRPEVIPTSDSPVQIAEELQTRRLKRAWLVGGGELATSFRIRGLISEYQIAFVPTILGDGIPLFAAGGPQDKLRLAGCESFPGGTILLRYLCDKTG